MHRSWSAINITIFSRDVRTHVFTLVLYVSSHPRSAFFEKMFWSHMIYKDVGTLCSCPLHRAHSSSRAVPDTASHNDTPREWHTKSNSDILLPDFEKCGVALLSLQPCDTCVDYKVPKVNISILHPSTASGRRAAHNMLFRMLANMNLSFQFPKDTQTADPPADSKGWAGVLSWQTGAAADWDWKKPNCTTICHTKGFPHSLWSSIQ